jgi:hypothetical protein
MGRPPPGFRRQWIVPISDSPAVPRNAATRTGLAIDQTLSAATLAASDTQDEREYEPRAPLHRSNAKL